MLDANQFNRIGRASAWYDLFVTLPFATPWSFGLLAGLVAWLDQTLGLPGEMPQPDMLTMLMGNLMGSVVVVWSVARLHLNTPLLFRYDALARFLFAAWQINALLSGLSWVMLPLLVVEIGFGIAQSLPVSSGVTRTRAGTS